MHPAEYKVCGLLPQAGRWSPAFWAESCCFAVAVSGVATGIELSALMGVGKGTYCT